MHNVFVKVDNVVGLVLEFWHDARELSNELHVAVVTSIDGRSISGRVVLMPKVAPSNVRTYRIMLEQKIDRSISIHIS